MYKTEEKQTCLECGREIYGRPDKKFCSLKCKNGHNNREMMHWRWYHNRVLTGLNTNHRILDRMEKEGVKSAGMEELRIMGFDPSYMTGSRRGRHVHEERYCFDISYCQSESRIYNIRRLDIVKPHTDE